MIPILLMKEEFLFSNPVCSAEVNSFCKVVALVEAAVVGSWESHNKLPSTLIGPVNLQEDALSEQIFN